MSRSAAGTAYWAFVVISWPAAGLFLATGGWSTCKDGSCGSDGIALTVLLLLLPVQAGLAGYLRSRFNAE
jgi:hypothetical protein